MAISAQVDEVSGVAGLLKPGDYVVVYATMKGGARRGDQGARTVVLIPRARVLAVGTSIGVEPPQTPQRSRSRRAVAH